MKRFTTYVLSGSLLLVGGVAAADRVDVVSENSENKIWAPPPAPLAPAYPAIVKDNDQVCVGVGYMIEKDGSTSGFIVLKSWSRAHGSGDKAAPAIDPFARNALAAVSQWKF